MQIELLTRIKEDIYGIVILNPGCILKSGSFIVQSLSHVRLYETLWTAACQPSLSFTVSWRLLKLMSFGLVMPSNRLIFSHSLLFMLSVFPSIRVFSNEKTSCFAALHIMWPKY